MFSMYYLDSKEEITHAQLLKPKIKWDLFVSGYNRSERVTSVFKKVNVKNKFWFLFPEYGFLPSQYPKGKVLISPYLDEAEYIHDVFSQIEGFSQDMSLCVDITGFMRPHIVFLLKYLQNIGVNKFHVLYSEPKQYARKEETSFSSNFDLVRQVAGFEGNHNNDDTKDVLLVGVGYDHRLASQVMLVKDSALVFQLQSLPSLSADMYQESIIRLHEVSLREDNVIFACANDPYVTAAVLSETYKKLKYERGVTNLYLSPLATKPQALGFGLFYLYELSQEPASIVFPFSKSYADETSTGCGKIWLYEINLP